MREHRHIVMGSRGTAIAAPGVIALVDAVPSSTVVPVWERLLFDDDADRSSFDPMVSLDPSALTSFALAASTERGTTITVHGDVTVEIDGQVWLAPATTTPATREVDDGSTVVLSLEETGAPTGQWVTTGVIAAGSVAVGSLAVDRAVATTPATASPINAESDLVPNAGDGADFGNLIGRAATPRSAAELPLPPTVELRQQPSSAITPDRAASTAPFIDRSRFDPAGVVRTSDGREFRVDAPIVFGRRPPGEPIAGQTPHCVVIDDTMISRHHATMRVVDGHLQVVDEGSTNGTTVSVPNEPTERCVPGQPVEVPLGATVEFGGALTATHHGGQAPC